MLQINDCFDVDPFQGLETEHLQIKFYRDHFNLRVSCVILFCYFKIEKNYLKGKCLYFPQNSTTKVCMSHIGNNPTLDKKFILLLRFCGYFPFPFRAHISLDRL